MSPQKVANGQDNRPLRLCWTYEGCLLALVKNYSMATVSPWTLRLVGGVPKKRGGSWAPSLVRRLARILVADWTGNSGHGRDTSASAPSYTDGRRTVPDEFDHACLVIAERAHTRQA